MLLGFSLIFVLLLAQSVQEHLQGDPYLSSVESDSITHTHPDRKLGIFCMKYFSGSTMREHPS